MPPKKAKKPKKAKNKGTANEAASHEFIPRLLTDDEWAHDSVSFPNLTRANAYVTDPGTYDGYNCIGWSIGDTDLEYDVEAVTGMVEFYKVKGYEEVVARSAAAEIDLFAVSNGHFASHASKKYTGPRPDGMPADLWESKIYPGNRMTHGRFELEGNAYGVVVKSFRKTAAKTD